MEVMNGSVTPGDPSSLSAPLHPPPHPPASLSSTPRIAPHRPATHTYPCPSLAQLLATSYLRPFPRARQRKRGRGHFASPDDPHLDQYIIADVGIPTLPPPPPPPPPPWSSDEERPGRRGRASTEGPYHRLRIIRASSRRSIVYPSDVLPSLPMREGSCGRRDITRVETCPSSDLTCDL
jgi:hypothetical protein